MLLRELKPGLCDDLEWRRDGEGGVRQVQGGGDIYIYIYIYIYTHLWLVHVDVWQRPTQYGKAIIPQLKINQFFKIKFHLSLMSASYRSRADAQYCVGFRCTAK